MHGDVILGPSRATGDLWHVSKSTSTVFRLFYAAQLPDSCTPELDVTYPPIEPHEPIAHSLPLILVGCQRQGTSRRLTGRFLAAQCP